MSKILPGIRYDLNELHRTLTEEVAEKRERDHADWKRRYYERIAKEEAAAKVRQAEMDLIGQQIVADKKDREEEKLRREISREAMKIKRKNQRID